MQEIQILKVALVADWIKDIGGAEKVFLELMEMYPEADIFSSVFHQENHPAFLNRKVSVSFIQRIPLLGKMHKFIPFLRPIAFESMDLSGYDLIISSSSAESKGVITKPGAVHICYCHTPTRYYWSHYFEYFNRLEFGILNPLARWVMPKAIRKLRMWDYCAAQRPDHMIANSLNVQNRIRKYYRREAQVVYPFIDVAQFPFVATKSDYFVCVGRVIPYKRFDLLVDAFNANGKRLILATATDNRLYRQLRKRSKPNIEWRFGLSDKEIRKLISEAQAFVFPSEEDFGIVPIEAMACGTPVIAFGKGGALETVNDNPSRGTVTGTFFFEQSPESLNASLQEFEQLKFDAIRIRRFSSGFDISVFRDSMKKVIDEALKKNNS